MCGDAQLSGTLLQADLDLRTRSLVACGGEALLHAFEPTHERQIGTIQHELRCVDDAAAEALGDLSLTLTEARLREAVGPAELVPVIDVERERDELRRVDAAFTQSRDPAVGRRTTAAAFRGI